MLGYVATQWRIFVQDLQRLWQNRVVLLHQTLTLALIVLMALMIWKALMVWTASDAPVVVVLSDSMVPGFRRGDVLFLSNRAKPDPLHTAGADLDQGQTRTRSVDPISVGDIVVFKLEEREIPIVHRVLEVRERGNKTVGVQGADQQQEVMHVDYLTKGDNNYVNDRGLYNGKNFLQRKDIVGRAVGVLRGVGFLTIYMNENPILKGVLIAFVAIIAFTTRET